MNFNKPLIMFPGEMSTNPYCRLCTLKSENFINVFHSDGTALELAPKIKQCLQIFLSPDDILPRTVCVNCCEKVLEYSDFFSMCSKSQDCLVGIFSGKGGERLGEVTQKDISNLEFTIGNLEDDKVSGVISTYQDDSLQRVESIQDAGSLLTQTDSRFISGMSKTMIAETSSILQNILGPSDDEGDRSSDDNSQSMSFTKAVWKCATCDEELPTLQSLKSHHLNVHGQVPVYKCVHCGKVYERYRSYSRHVKTHISPNKFSCTICGKSFSQKSILQSHSAVHSEVRPHVCIYCGKSFKQFSTLYLHSKCHLPDRAKTKFPCTQCDKTFTTKPSLESHMNTHTGEKNFICDICGKRFFVKNSLDYHISTHTNEKPHDCPTCGKCFKTRRLLSKHTSVHTGIKPHQCDICGKQFRERSALREHTRIHTGAMPYACEFCGKLFRFKGILTVHRRLHTGERPYSCEICKKEFTNWANYNKHVKRRHSNVTIKEQIVKQPEPPPENTVNVVEPPPSFDSDLGDLVGQQYLQPNDSHNLFRTDQFPASSLQMASYYLPTHAVLSNE